MINYIELGTTVGKLVNEKQQAYGDAISKTRAVMRILYPKGVPEEKIDDMLLVVRVLDKLCRLAGGEKTAFGESPWRDIAGYGLLGVAKDTKGDNMNFNEYQLAAARTMKKGRPFEDDLADYTLGLSEAGECQNKLKKYLYHGHPMDKDSIAEELGDIMWYVAAIATTLHLDLDEVARAKLRNS